MWQKSLLLFSYFSSRGNSSSERILLDMESVFSPPMVFRITDFWHLTSKVQNYDLIVVHLMSRLFRKISSISSILRNISQTLSLCYSSNESYIMTMHLRTRLCFWEFLANKQITMLEHLPYSPDFAFYGFYFQKKIYECFILYLLFCGDSQGTFSIIWRNLFLKDFCVWKFIKSSLL